MIIQQLLHPIIDINKVNDTVNRELVGVDNWLKVSRLSFNVSKTSCMIVSNLTKVSTVKFLGVTLDENLSFNDHINKVMRRLLSVPGRRNA